MNRYEAEEMVRNAELMDCHIAHVPVPVYGVTTLTWTDYIPLEITDKVLYCLPYVDTLHNDVCGVSVIVHTPDNRTT